MNFSKDIKKNILSAESSDFDELAFQVYQYQYSNCEVFRKYLNLVNKSPSQVSSINDFGFLPIEFFKSFQVISTPSSSYTNFTSSGTTGNQTSTHFVSDLNFYKLRSQQIFESYYGNLSQYKILALLPSYLEREGSSLVWMVNEFIQETKQHHSSFYLHNIDELLHSISDTQTPTILFGVTFALLDLAERNNIDLSHCIVIETGGMKGKRKEITRAELHHLLCKGLNISKVHSEYGMTELLSQAYSLGDGIFTFPSYMKVLLRELNDPFYINNQLRYGAINIIDLANIDSCSFIATQDLGRYVSEYEFEILGRTDASDVRGCNLMVV